MGTTTPSSRRRDGRNAFQPCADPEEACPYKKGGWNYKYYYPDFLEGWKESEKEYQEEKEESITLTLKEEVDNLKRELEDLRMEFETHTGYFNPDDI